MKNCKCSICDLPGEIVFQSENSILARYGFFENADKAKSINENLNLSIYYCSECDFAWNSDFDYSKIDYHGETIIEAGHFSRRYLEYQSQSAKLIAKLIGCRPKRIVEIGAGEGLFLREIDADHKIAIEPSHEAKKISDPNIEVFNTYFTPDRFDFAADLVVMRQVLEHIENPVGFLIEIIRSFGKGDNFHLYIEVPSSYFTFNDGRFYDYYFEHCNYFTHKSLIAIAERIGLSVSFCSSGMDGEITSILLSKKKFSGYFLRSCQNKKIDELSEIIKTFINMGRKFLMWGASGNGSQIINHYNIGINIMPYVIDSDANKQGKFLPRTLQRIVSPEEALHYNPQAIFITSQFHRDEIERSCREIFGDIEIISIR